MRIAHTASSAISEICLKTRTILWQPRWGTRMRKAHTAIAAPSLGICFKSRTILQYGSQGTYSIYASALHAQLAAPSLESV